MSADIKITGLEILEREMKKLPGKFSKDIVRTSIRETANKIALKRVKSNARSMIGGKMGRLIAKNLKYKGYKKQKKGQYAGFIGVSAKGNADFVVMGKGLDDKGKPKRHYIPNAIEFGHGNAKAIPYQRDAYRKSLAASQRRLAREITVRTKRGLSTHGFI